jgi:hypothetical protein
VKEKRGRGLGPFSGAQLTVIIVVFAVLLLAPIGAWAVSGSNVFVTDAGSGARAQVDGAYQLTVTRAAPKSFTTAAAFPITSSATTVAVAPTGKALVITNIVVDAYKVAAPGLGSNVEFFVSKTDATCAHLSAVVTDVNPGGIGATALPYDPGVVIPVGRALCVINGNPSNTSVEVYAAGYVIPSGAAPSPADARGGNPAVPHQARH